jgi:hypothetical protein
VVFELRRTPMGPTLVFLGIFGGGLLWMVLTGLRFEYLITNVYHGDPGEAIWSLDPLFTVIAAVPGLILVFVGIALSFQTAPEQPKDIKSEVGYHQINLYYIGEISLLVTSIVSFVGFLGVSQSTIEINHVSATIMGTILITCLAQLLSSVLGESIPWLDSLKLSRDVAIVLAMELFVLPLFVISLRLYTSSFIRWTTLAITSSGFLGLLLLAPRFLNPKSKSGTEGEDNA